MFKNYNVLVATFSIKKDKNLKGEFKKNMKKCKIIGYAACENKETKEELFRIVIGIPSISEKYKGTMTTTAFLEKTNELEKTLDKAITNNIDVYYETSENIITGKTKITKIRLFDDCYESNDEDDI